MGDVAQQLKCWCPRHYGKQHPSPALSCAHTNLQHPETSVQPEQLQQRSTRARAFGRFQSRLQQTIAILHDNPVLEVTQSPPLCCHTGHHIQVLRRANPYANPAESSGKPGRSPPSSKKIQKNLKSLNNPRTPSLQLQQQAPRRDVWLQALGWGCAEIPPTASTPLRKGSHEGAAPQPPHLRAGETRETTRLLQQNTH